MISFGPLPGLFNVYELGSILLMWHHCKSSGSNKTYCSQRLGRSENLSREHLDRIGIAGSETTQLTLIRWESIDFRARGWWNLSEPWRRLELKALGWMWTRSDSLSKLNSSKANNLHPPWLFQKFWNLEDFISKVKIPKKNVLLTRCNYSIKMAQALASSRFPRCRLVIPSAFRGKVIPHHHPSPRSKLEQGFLWLIRETLPFKIQVTFLH